MKDHCVLWATCTYMSIKGWHIDGILDIWIEILYWPMLIDLNIIEDDKGTFWNIGQHQYANPVVHAWLVHLHTFISHTSLR